MAHACRRFIEAEGTAPEIARAVVDVLFALFRVEEQAREFSVDQRRSLRQAQSAPLLTQSSQFRTIVRRS